MTHVLALGGEGEPGLKKKIGVLGTLPRMRSYPRGESVGKYFHPYMIDGIYFSVFLKRGSILRSKQMTTSLMRLHFKQSSMNPSSGLNQIQLFGSQPTKSVNSNCPKFHNCLGSKQLTTREFQKISLKLILINPLTYSNRKMSGILICLLLFCTCAIYFTLHRITCPDIKDGQKWLAPPSPLFSILFLSNRSGMML